MIMSSNSNSNLSAPFVQIVNEAVAQFRTEIIDNLDQFQTQLTESIEVYLENAKQQLVIATQNDGRAEAEANSLLGGNNSSSSSEEVVEQMSWQRMDHLMLDNTMLVNGDGGSSNADDDSNKFDVQPPHQEQEQKSPGKAAADSVSPSRATATTTTTADQMLLEKAITLPQKKPPRKRRQHALKRLKKTAKIPKPSSTSPIGAIGTGTPEFSSANFLICTNGNVRKHPGDQSTSCVVDNSEQKQKGKKKGSPGRKKKKQRAAGEKEESKQKQTDNSAPAQTLIPSTPLPRPPPIIIFPPAKRPMRNSTPATAAAGKSRSFLLPAEKKLSLSPISDTESTSSPSRERTRTETDCVGGATPKKKVRFQEIKEKELFGKAEPASASTTAATAFAAIGSPSSSLKSALRRQSAVHSQQPSSEQLTKPLKPLKPRKNTRAKATAATTAAILNAMKEAVAVAAATTTTTTTEAVAVARAEAEVVNEEKIRADKEIEFGTQQTLDTSNCTDCSMITHPGKPAIFLRTRKVVAVARARKGQELDDDLPN